MKTIKLTQGKFAIVDDDMFEFLNQWKWYFDTHGYAARRQYIIGKKGKSKKLYIHRVIMNNPKNMKVDHINGDKLDCRKENLRVCSHSLNLANRGKTIKNTSGFKGVGFRKDRNKWRAYIKVDYKYIHLGDFSNVSEAAIAYNKASEKYFGEFGYQNQVGGNV